MSATIVLREDWYDEQVYETGQVLDVTERRLTFYSIDHPVAAGHIVSAQFFGNGGYTYNTSGTDLLEGTVFYADVPTYTPPGVTDPAGWRENILLNVLPYLELNFTGSFGVWQRLPYLYPYETYANDYGTSFDVRLTGCAIDGRTAGAYDWDYRNHPNDFPFAFTIVIQYPGAAGRPRPPQWFHAYPH